MEMTEGAGKTRLAMAGANGRMGQSLQKRLESDEGFVLIGQIEKSQPSVDAILKQNQQLLESVDVVVDFTNAAYSVELAQGCSFLGSPALVIDSTGQSSESVARIIVASSQIPILRSGNFSVGLNVMLGLVEFAGSLFQSCTWDAPIFAVKFTMPMGL
jgi:4-hydroxy-tetrahydrodipicolinate reductase